MKAAVVYETVEGVFLKYTTSGDSLADIKQKVLNDRQRRALRILEVTEVKNPDVDSVKALRAQGLTAKEIGKLFGRSAGFLNKFIRDNNIDP